MIGDYPTTLRDWDEKFVLNLKDWFDKKKLKATEKQASHIERIWDLVSDVVQDNWDRRFDFNWEDYTVGI